MRTELKAISDTIVAYKLVWVRVACYFVLPFAVTFLSLTETWTGDTWTVTAPFLKARLFASCFVSGLTSFVAYLDSSFTKANQAATVMKDKRDAETNFKQRPENG